MTAAPLKAAGLAVTRAAVTPGRKLDVLALLSSSASGSVDVAFQAAGRTSRFSTPITGGKLRVNRAIPARQARGGSGTLTLTYRGDADTQPQIVRLVAATRAAALKAKRPTIANGRVKATGTVAKRVRGSIKLELRVQPAGATQARFVTFTATISKGRYKLDKPVSAAVASELATSPAVSATIVFAGDKRNGIAGQSAYFELPATSPA